MSCGCIAYGACLRCNNYQATTIPPFQCPNDHECAKAMASICDIQLYKCDTTLEQMYRKYLMVNDKTNANSANQKPQLKKPLSFEKLGNEKVMSHY